MKRNKKVLAVTLATSLIASSISTGITAQAQTSVSDATIQLSDEDIAKLGGVSEVDRTSVHDPSIVKDGDTYYIFGSHMAVSKTDCEIANIWNADIESDTDNHYVITNKGYNEKIAPGESVTFGFNGENGTVDNVPAEYKVSAYILTK